MSEPEAFRWIQRTAMDRSDDHAIGRRSGDLGRYGFSHGHRSQLTPPCNNTCQTHSSYVRGGYCSAISGAGAGSSAPGVFHTCTTRHIHMDPAHWPR